MLQEESFVYPEITSTYIRNMTIQCTVPTVSFAFYEILIHTTNDKAILSQNSWQVATIYDT